MALLRLHWRSFRMETLHVWPGVEWLVMVYGGFGFVARLGVERVLRGCGLSVSLE